VVAPPFPFPAFSRLCVAYCLGELFEPDNRMFVFLPLVISITVVTAMVCMACMGNPSDGGMPCGHVSQIMHVGYQASWRCRSKQLVTCRQPMTREARLP
jgi:hypothetical protein